MAFRRDNTQAITKISMPEIQVNDLGLFFFFSTKHWTLQVLSLMLCALPCWTRIAKIIGEAIIRFVSPRLG